MQHSNPKKFHLEMLEDQSTDNLDKSLEAILAQLEQNQQFISEYPDVEELGLKHISRNKRAVIERMIALCLFKSKQKPNESRTEFECA